MLAPRLFDVHTHTHFHAYEKDSAEVIERALEKGIWMINVGTDRETSKEAIEVARRYPEGVYATVGLHPNDVEKEEFNPEHYKALAADEKVVAIGECGLDYFRTTEANTQVKQREVFEQHIKLSRETQKPLMIHCRNAFADLIDTLTANRPLLLSNPGIIHFFSGSVEDAKKLMDLGFSFSFGGVITFARDYDEQIRLIPLERILLETDAPYVAPAPHRGKRNEPSYIEATAQKIAELKGASIDEIAAKTTQNALKFLPQ